MLKLLKITALLALLGTSTANAAIIYKFTGTCSSGCSGTAIGTLILGDSYVPGTPAAGQPALWGFVSNGGSLASISVILSGALPTGSSPASLSFFGAALPLGLQFTSTFAGGNWSVSLIGLGGFTVRGRYHEWTRVPEPMTVLLVALGLIGVGFARRKSA